MTPARLRRLYPQQPNERRLVLAANGRGGRAGRQALDAHAPACRPYAASTCSSPTNGDSSASNGISDENPDPTRYTKNPKRSRPPSPRPLRKQGGRRSPAPPVIFLPGLVRGARGRE